MKLKRSVNIFINSFLFYDTFVYNVSGYMIWTLQMYCFYFIHQRKVKEKFKKMIFIFLLDGNKKYPVIGWITGYEIKIYIKCYALTGFALT